MKLPSVFFPRGTLQYQTSSEWLKLSVARGLCHKHDSDGFSLDIQSSKVLTGQVFHNLPFINSQVFHTYILPLENHLVDRLPCGFYPVHQQLGKQTFSPLH